MHSKDTQFVLLSNDAHKMVHGWGSPSLPLRRLTIVPPRPRRSTLEATTLEVPDTAWWRPLGQAAAGRGQPCRICGVGAVVELRQRWWRATAVVEWLVGVGAEDKEARVTLRDGIWGWPMSVQCMEERRRWPIFRSRRQAHPELVAGIGHLLEDVFGGFDPPFKFG
jgi:hypothetical protein